MSPEDDVRADSISRAARALLTVLASEGIDIPETRALGEVLAQSRALRPFDTSAEDFVELGRRACRESLARVEQAMGLPLSKE